MSSLGLSALLRNQISIIYSRGVLWPLGIRRFGNGVSQLSPLRPILGNGVPLIELLRNALTFEFIGLECGTQPVSAVATGPWPMGIRDNLAIANYDKVKFPTKGTFPLLLSSSHKQQNICICRQKLCSRPCVPRPLTEIRAFDLRSPFFVFLLDILFVGVRLLKYKSN
jgi:hypothetical protein